jgi:hypothetical protein
MQRQSRLRWLCRLGLTRELAHPGPVDVVALVAQRHDHVERVAGSHEVRRAVVDRDPVQWRVGLDEPSMALRRRFRGLEDQQRADHL